ncbi:MAG: YicC/YloC family endoribonuclease, partial [Hyphomicrobiaceae bacterium]
MPSAQQACECSSWSSDGLPSGAIWRYGSNARSEPNQESRTRDMTINSMTGFARSGGNADGMAFHWELRSVNG